MAATSLKQWFAAKAKNYHEGKVMTAKYDELMVDPEFRKMLAVETLVASASEEIARLMRAQKLTKAELARRLGKSRAWVTQLLSGSANMTVRTLAEVTFALGGEVKLQVKAQGGRRLGRAREDLQSERSTGYE